MPNAYPEVKDGLLWVRKMRTLFRRLDSNGHGYVLVDDILDAVTNMMHEFSKMESYESDELVKMAVNLWYTVIAAHVDRHAATTTQVNEATFVSNMLKAFQGGLRTDFEEQIVIPLFAAADHDKDGLITQAEYVSLMVSWRSPQRDSELVYNIVAKNSKMSKEQFKTLMVDFFMTDDSKSQYNRLWGPLVNYKRAEDYGTIDCGPVWEGKMRTMFRRLDINQTGKLRCHDLLQIGHFLIQRNHLERKKGDAVLRAMLTIWVKFLAIDKNGKHLDEIREIEFIHNLRDMINGDYRHMIDQFGWTFFKAVEVDASGYLSQTAYRNLQEAWHVGREEAEGMFKIIDTDKDGRISSDEYLTAWVEYFVGEDPQSPYKMFFGPVIYRPTEAR